MRILWTIWKILKIHISFLKLLTEGRLFFAEGKLRYIVLVREQAEVG